MFIFYLSYSLIRYKEYGLSILLALVSLTENSCCFEAKEKNPRGRMHYDLRTSTEEPAGTWHDSSQRMLNVHSRDGDTRSQA